MPSSRTFRYSTYGDAVRLLQSLAASAPHLTDLSTTQSLFGLSTAGTCVSADGSRGPCLNYVLQITNKATYTSSRPEVLISGALHGDERVGVVTALELCRWLVERYHHDEWVKRLVDTRNVLIMPMTNAIGVAQKTRAENGIDPNRDFPFDQSPSLCMQTIAARSVNELYRSHLLQLVVTFHGGMQAIGYEWGAYPYYYSGSAHRSPDDNMMRQISSVLSSFAGSGNVPGNRPYPNAPMNDLVYPVHGGMEDWGYAASWDRGKVRTCNPRTYGGYPQAKTSYGDGDARAFTVLVETSDSKAPYEGSLGAESGVYMPGSAGDGHVPRNMRLALAAIDLVQPYVSAWQVATANPAPNVVCVSWSVWGAIVVEEAAILRRDSPSSPWTVADLADGHGQAVTKLAQGVWGASSSPMRPVVKTDCVTLGLHAKGSAELAVRARVDPSWGHAPASKFALGTGPQSHLAKSRAAGYSSKVGTHTLSSRLEWMSQPLLANASSFKHFRRHN